MVFGEVAGEAAAALLFSRVPLMLLQATITRASTATGIWDEIERGFICGFLKTRGGIDGNDVVMARVSFTLVRGGPPGVCAQAHTRSAQGRCRACACAQTRQQGRRTLAFMQLTTLLGNALAGSTLPAQMHKLAVALAACALVVLLVVFVQVLQSATARADLRWRSDAAVADATWRCNALRGAAARTACLGSLQSPGSVP